MTTSSNRRIVSLPPQGVHQAPSKGKHALLPSNSRVAPTVEMLNLLRQGILGAFLIGLASVSNSASPAYADESLDRTLLGLFRTTVTLRQPRDDVRLAKLAVLPLTAIPDTRPTTIVVLTDGAALDDLARLRFDPKVTDELGDLLAANPKVNDDLASTIRRLLSETKKAEATVLVKTAARKTSVSYAGLPQLRQTLVSMIASERAALSMLEADDDDSDGLTNTQEGWWCTDPDASDSDGDGASDGSEVAEAKAWLGNLRSGPPSTGIPMPDWPPKITGCRDLDQDSIPNLAERWDLGLNMNDESTDHDKFDDGQELFGATYCPGSAANCGYGVLPRDQDWGVIKSGMPAWVIAPGNHPFVAAFPVPEIQVADSSFRVTTVTQITTDHTISEGTERSYATSETNGQSTSMADTTTWNAWEEVSETKPIGGRTTQLNVVLERPSHLSSLEEDLKISFGDRVITGESISECIIGGGLGLAAAGTGIGSLLGVAAIAAGCHSLGYNLLGGTLDIIGNALTAPTEVLVPIGDYPASEPVDFSLCTYDSSGLTFELITCRPKTEGLTLPGSQELLKLGSQSGLRIDEKGYAVLDRPGKSGGTLKEVSKNTKSGTMRVTGQSAIPMSFPMLQPVPTRTETKGSSHGGAHTEEHTTYKEYTTTEANAFSDGESWGDATAVNSVRAAQLTFRYVVRNRGTEYAREIGEIAFSIYIGDDPNPVTTHFVADDIKGDGLIHNLMPGNERAFTAKPIDLTLDQLKAIDTGSPLRIVVESYTYGIDQLFYQDAVSAGVTVSVDDGVDDEDQTIERIILPTWGSETNLEILTRYFPYETDVDGHVIGLFTPERRSDTPIWCDSSRRIGDTVWCRQGLSVADWWNTYASGVSLQDGGLEESSAKGGSLLFLRFNSDRDLDGYSDRSEALLGTNADNKDERPDPAVVAGIHTIMASQVATATLSLVNKGLYDAYGVKAVMIAPNPTISVTNNIVGGAGRVRAASQVVVGGRVIVRNGTTGAWSQVGHARPAASGYYTGAADRLYTFTVSCNDPVACQVGSGTWTLNWNDDLGASGPLTLGVGIIHHNI